MKSTRRGFLGLIGGGAVTGPKVLGAAIRGAAGQVHVGNLKSSIASSNDLGIGGAPDDNVKWLAGCALDTIRSGIGPAKLHPHEEQYLDIEALVSVSRGQKARMASERKRQERISAWVRDFAEAYKLDLLGIKEGELIRLLEKVAGKNA